MLEQLLEKIESRKAVIGIVGLGYVGLPLVREFAGGGAKVLGFDVDAKKVKSLLAGKSYIDHIPSRTVKEIVQQRAFRCHHRFHPARGSRLHPDLRSHPVDQDART